MRYMEKIIKIIIHHNNFDKRDINQIIIIKLKRITREVMAVRSNSKYGFAFSVVQSSEFCIRSFFVFLSSFFNIYF